jgi:Rps23 Pro-64 3,4-dihydroxylase Tpa1-like proline 4-hydroxylase
MMMLLEAGMFVCSATLLCFDARWPRRVSYILYLPLPVEESWDAQYGGALELYPTFLNSTGVLEPASIPTKMIPPSWNQFVFFEVQPGRSFHSVEEVVVPSGMNPRERLSISGWFHKPQEGEDGYEPEAVTETLSSLEQLVRSETFT